jgi:hypothetical protein
MDAVGRPLCLKGPGPLGLGTAIGEEEASCWQIRGVAKNHLVRRRVAH